MISADTKDALAREPPTADHCRRALLGGLALYGRRGAEFVTHRNAVARLFWSLLDERKTHPIVTRTAPRLRRAAEFAIVVPPRLRDMPAKHARKCDRLMELRAAFLACGSLATGTQGYHLEFVPVEDALAERLQRTLHASGVPSKTSRRKGRLVVYYKDLDAIVELLTLIGAYGAVLRLEDVRALRETKNRIHRIVNTEAANLERAARAATAQREAIALVADAYGMRRLSAPLQEVARLRLAHPDESLAELGRRCAPPASKPTVSSRLAALSRLAAQIRTGQGHPDEER